MLGDSGLKLSRPAAALPGQLPTIAGLCVRVIVSSLRVGLTPMALVAPMPAQESSARMWQLRKGPRRAVQERATAGPGEGVRLVCGVEEFKGRSVQLAGGQVEDEPAGSKSQNAVGILLGHFHLVQVAQGRHTFLPTQRTE